MYNSGLDSECASSRRVSRKICSTYMSFRVVCRDYMNSHIMQRRPFRASNGNEIFQQRSSLGCKNSTHSHCIVPVQANTILHIRCMFQTLSEQMATSLWDQLQLQSIQNLGLLDFTYFVIYRVLYHGSHWLSSLPVSLSCRNPQGKTQWHWCGLLLPVDRKHGDAGRGNALNL